MCIACSNVVSTRVPLPPSGPALLSQSYASARSNEPLNNCLLMIDWPHTRERERERERERLRFIVAARHRWANNEPPEKREIVRLTIGRHRIASSTSLFLRWCTTLSVTVQTYAPVRWTLRRDFQSRWFAIVKSEEILELIPLDLSPLYKRYSFLCTIAHEYSKGIQIELLRV